MCYFVQKDIVIIPASTTEFWLTVREKHFVLTDKINFIPPTMGSMCVSRWIFPAFRSPLLKSDEMWVLVISVILATFLLTSRQGYREHKS